MPAALYIKSLVVSPYGTNCYLVGAEEPPRCAGAHRSPLSRGTAQPATIPNEEGCNKTPLLDKEGLGEVPLREVIAIDPGGDSDLILRLIESEGLKVVAIVNTHGHGDHIGANADLKHRFDCPIMIHEADAEFLTDPVLNLSAYLGVEAVLSPAADRLLQDDDEIEVGPITFRVIHTGGHTPGGICLYTDGHLFAGDTLFAGSVGRTDFPGGSMEQLITGIREKLLVLPDDTIVYSGHGPTTTIGDEKAANPYL